MRVAAFVLAVMSVFGVLVYTIWLESAVVAEAYQIYQLRQETAAMKNRIHMRKADLAARSRPAALSESAAHLGLDGLERNAAVVVVGKRIDNTARGAD